MAEFDAELYLRLTGERDLLDHKSEDGLPGSTELGAAAHALVAVGAVPAGGPRPSWTTTTWPSRTGPVSTIVTA